MIALNVILYTFVSGVMLMMSAMGLESAIITPSLNRLDRRFFIAFFVSLLASSSTFFLELAAYMDPSLQVFQIMAYFLQSVLFSIPYPLLAVYLLHCCGESWRTSFLLRVVMAIWVVYFIMVCVAQFSSYFYYIAPNYELQFGPGYLLAIGLLLVMLLIVSIGVVRRRKKLSRRRYRAFLICLSPVAIALLVHMLVPVFTLINFALIVSAYSMHRIIVTDSIERDKRHEQELASQRASIAVLQMRPHFIYNTMTTIYYLCDQDPELAKRVTMDFTVYLRRNFAAIVNENAVPFSEELEHTRAYLAVEQAQFEDDLLVSYDTPHVQFRMPPLTLQPIVENAVKHGMDPDSGPLHIWIQARKTDSGSEVTVTDDGSGFDPAIAEDPHTTLANIRERLKMMCGGTLHIAPREGGGTVVRATVPWQS